ncbi:hypothetical protein OH687_18690 [Burkholderia anthina]|nr:hypothetical protein OH687_18690 [Burkholderia anthina]
MAGGFVNESIRQMYPVQGRHRLCPSDQHPSESRKVGQPHGCVAAAKPLGPSR